MDPGLDTRQGFCTFTVNNGTKTDVRESVAIEDEGKYTVVANAM
jgi:hypothetical protein